jgi:putative transposase
MCRLLGVSPSSYYAWRNRKPSARRCRDVELLELIRLIHESTDGIYGAPRIWAEFRIIHRIRCGRKRVARLMREAGLRGVCRRRRRGCTKRADSYEPYPDLVERDFRAAAPNRLWVADLTEHPTGEGKLFLASVIDVYSRRVVGWSMSARATADFASEALSMALCRRQPEEQLVHHSDHGSQYTATVYSQRMTEAGLLGSMGTVGDALDNAVAEAFYASLQTELLDRRRWESRGQLRTAIFSYIEGFYNRRRHHSTLGYLSPEDFERESTGEKPKQDAAALAAATT